MAGKTNVSHELKCWPAPYDALRSGEKTCEIRRDDRGFNVGDVLWLREWTAGNPGTYTGQSLRFLVTHIDRGPDWSLPMGHVVMSIRRVS